MDSTDRGLAPVGLYLLESCVNSTLLQTAEGLVRKPVAGHSAHSLLSVSWLWLLAFLSLDFELGQVTSQQDVRI